MSEKQRLDSLVSDLDSFHGLALKDKGHYARRGRDVLVLQYRYTGIKDDVMSEVPLSAHSLK
jgi:hypothetical protein